MTRLLKWMLNICLLAIYINPAYAIPPPETLALLGGSIAYPGFLLFGLLTLLLKYIWVKTKFYLWWRRHFVKILCLLLLITIPLPKQWFIKNHSVGIETIKSWQESDSKPVFIDVRDQNSYDRVHLLGAIHIPFGQGIADYIKSNPHKRFVIYCSIGVTSSTLFGLPGQEILHQALDENRLFYLPGGINELMKLGKSLNVPFIINIPSNFAHYLLKKPGFKEILFSDNHREMSALQLKSAYEKIIQAHQTPIISSTFSSDAIAELLSPLSMTHLFFTTPALSNPYPVSRLIGLICFLFVILFALRWHEFFAGVFSKPTQSSQWKYVFISMMMSFLVVFLGLANLFIPFDFDLYEQNTHLPMDMRYLYALYAFFATVLMLHLIYPDKKRFHFMLVQLGQVFAPRKYVRTFSCPTIQELWIVGLSVGALYLFRISLSTTFILSLFLLTPLLVDLLLWRLIALYKDTSTHQLNLLKRCGYEVCPHGVSAIQLNTLHESILGAFTVTKGDESALIGLFTGKPLKEEMPNKHSEKGVGLPKTTFIEYSKLIQNLLLFFQQDFLLHLDHIGSIVSLELFHNHEDRRVVSRQALLKHHQLAPENTSERRFSSVLFQDVFKNPNPFMFDLLTSRWDKKGGCVKALYKLGLLMKYNSQCKDQWMAFSHQIYLDETFEKAIFSTQGWLNWIRKKILNMRLHLALDTILQDFDTIILPKTELRLTTLTEHLEKPTSLSELKRTLNRALNAFCKESGQWQCYTSLLHQHAFQQLQWIATNRSIDMSLLLNPPRHSLPSYYELSEHPSLIGSELPFEEDDTLSYYRRAFLKTEVVRTSMRQLQLKEWQLISQMLEKLRKKLNVPMSLVYLTKEDFRHLPKDKDKLLDLLNYRYHAWQVQNDWPFPSDFSLEDQEQLVSEATKEKSSASGIRVSGHQQIIMGHAVIFQDHLMLNKMPRGSILIADNLLPEQIVSCQHIHGVILKKGGYLSHTSIIAREKNIPLIVQFPIANIQDQAKLLIHHGNQVNVFENKMLAWEFLEGITHVSSIGNKAQRLANLCQKGFHLPPTLVLPNHSVEKIYQYATLKANDEKAALLSEALYEEIVQLFGLLSQIGLPLIVRSSTNVEDSREHSYAGIFYSESGIETMDAFVSAISAAWQNVLNRRDVIAQYSGQTEIVLNLILQPYIQGQYGGVLFTQSDYPGMMHLEISERGVEGVTEGHAIVSSIHIDERGQVFHAHGEASKLSMQEYQMLFRLGRELNDFFGQPQDIEWILKDHQIYIIQSRDISTNT